MLISVNNIRKASGTSTFSIALGVLLSQATDFSVLLIDGNYIYNSSNSQIGRTDGNYLYDSSNRQIGRIDGNYIYNGSNSQIGRADGLTREQIILFFYFYGMN